MGNIKRFLIEIGVMIFILGIVAAVVIPRLLRQRVSPAQTPLEVRLRHDNDSLVTLNSILNKRDSALVIENDSLSKGVAGNKTKVIYLNNKKNEGLYIIDGYYSNELFRQFSSVNTKGFN